ncbi:anhydro-N-acetylmuramic acid kinase [Oceaniovalibus guishaninsula JLT2003]|uniref:Anhydro-N-acetylmuramic acid kinase n=1 Tax=Oceaniovalibus guishaninsula JLT2003 TaxID=1231392 RepID=K2HLD3_9RHOB|nr:anhydro-N-acetylmuramic acid kinase [Oceaniovalibus guishaninsula]EKE43674.1 anhydro-N-acetylmuramic acid kinase [Oceaniovalibus guishaninsula JLT2003]
MSGPPHPLRALGAMSGTSLDGVDAAVVVTDGEAIHGFGPVAYRAYAPDEVALLRAALGRWDGCDRAARLVEDAHADVLAGFDAPDIVGFHGQTVAHDPEAGRTRQIGDGAALARRLGVKTVWDFRSEDMRQGGQGAPLAPFWHHACARWIAADAPLAFVNLGGVGNLTWVDPRIARPETPGACLAFDTGPANAPLNDLMQQRLGRAMDADGALALRGRVDDGVLARLAALPWFARRPPKSLDRDAFAWLNAAVAGLKDADAAATLTACAARAVALGMAHCPAPPSRLLVTGGGRRNPAMMARLAAEIGCPVDPVEAVGLDGDMLEAQAFAYLAVRVLRGLPTSCPGTTGAARPVCGGRIDGP